MSGSGFKVLLVDDEQDILDMIQYNLEREGYIVEVALNGQEGIEKAKQFVPDLIILDVMMPVMDGIETCQELRKDSAFDQTVITFLTARAEDYSQIAGYDSGADDYITKPIKPRLLISKVQSLLRRKSGEAKKRLLSWNDITLDEAKHLVTLANQELSLPKKEFSLLALLMSTPERVFTREEILETVWGSDIVVGDRTIDVHIRKLREKIGEKAIKTVKGVGYKLSSDES